LSERLRAIRYSHGRTLISRSSAGSREGGGEDLLQHVLGVLARRQHVAAEREKPRLVAGDERLEGVVVPAPDQGDQALVRLQAEQRRAAVDAGDAGVLEG
jgi:hypothetical protein